MRHNHSWELAPILFMALALIVHAIPDDLVNSNLAAKAEVVLRVKLLTLSYADKYAWYEVEIRKVYKNESGEIFGKKLKIAAYSWKPGIPAGLSTVYLERYNITEKGLWKIVGGEASTGVSHTENPPKAQPAPPNAASPSR